MSSRTLDEKIHSEQSREREREVTSTKQLTDRAGQLKHSTTLRNVVHVTTWLTNLSNYRRLTNLLTQIRCTFISFEKQHSLFGITHARTHPRTHTHAHTHIHTHTRSHMRAHMYTHTNTQARKHARARAHWHTHTHTHAHVYHTHPCVHTLHH